MLMILLSALAVSADAEAPKTAPTILTASIKDEKLVVKLTHVVVVPVTVVTKEKVGDKEVEVPKTTFKMETRTIEQKHDLKKATFGTAGGKKLDLDAVKKKLEKPTPIVVSGDGKEIDESYLKLFDKDVIVIVLPIPMPKIPLPPPPPPPAKDGPPVPKDAPPKKEDK
jgi:hypothetical protein